MAYNAQAVAVGVWPAAGMLRRSTTVSPQTNVKKHQIPDTQPPTVASPLRELVTLQRYAGVAAHEIDQ